MMNAKPDSKTKLFTKDVCINLDDIFNLNYLITDKFKSHYNNAGFIINVHVAFNNKNLYSLIVGNYLNSRNGFKVNLLTVF